MIRPISVNPFKGIATAQLATIQATYLQAVIDIATTGISYSVPGRTFNAGSLDDIKDTLAELQSAIDYGNGASTTVNYPRVYPYCNSNRSTGYCGEF